MIQDVIAQQHAQNVNQFQKLSGAQAHIADMQKALAPMAALGQSVSRDDIMEQIMQLVERGRLSSKEAAIAMGQMPLQGPALAEWVQGHLARYAQLQQKLGGLHEQARQNMVSTAVHGLVHALAGGAPPNTTPSNSLVNAAPPQGAPDAGTSSL